MVYLKKTAFIVAFAVFLYFASFFFLFVPYFSAPIGAPKEYEELFFAFSFAEEISDPFDRNGNYSVRQSEHFYKAYYPVASLEKKVGSGITAFVRLLIILLPFILALVYCRNDKKLALKTIAAIAALYFFYFVAFLLWIKNFAYPPERAPEFPCLYIAISLIVFFVLLLRPLIRLTPSLNRTIIYSICPLLLAILVGLLRFFTISIDPYL